MDLGFRHFLLSSECWQPQDNFLLRLFLQCDLVATAFVSIPFGPMSHMIAFIKPISTKTSPGELCYLQIRTLTSIIMAADLRLSNIALKNCFSDGVRSKATVGVKLLQQQEGQLWRTVATCKEELGKPGKTKFLIIKRRKLCERKNPD